MNDNKTAMAMDINMSNNKSSYSSEEEYTSKSIAAIHNIIEIIRSITKETDTLKDVEARLVRSDVFNINAPTLTLTNVILQQSNKNESRNNKQEYLIFHVFTSALENVVRSYSKLDNDATTGTENEKNDDIEQQQQQKIENRTHDEESINLKKNVKVKTQAPAGLLSLQDYTDLSIFLNLTICITLYPLLSTSLYKNISIQNYLNTYLYSKTLRGRMPRHIQWMTQQNELSLPLDKVMYIANTLEDFLSLHRFRPMFLPKYIDLIYATHLYFTQKSQKHYNQQKSLLFIQNVPPQILAKSCQSFLSSSNCEEPWVKRQASIELNTLLKKNLLCVLHVFVPLNCKDWAIVTGAALRMAYVLKFYLEGSKVKDVSFLARELIRLLVQENTSSDNNTNGDSFVVSGGMVVTLVYSALLRLLLPSTRGKILVLQYLIPKHYCITNTGPLSSIEVQQMIQIIQSILLVSPKTTANDPVLNFFITDLFILHRILRISAVPLSHVRPLSLNVIQDLLLVLDMNNSNVIARLEEAILPMEEFDDCYTFQLCRSTTGCTLLTSSSTDGNTSREEKVEQLKRRVDVVIELLLRMKKRSLHDSDTIVRNWIGTLFHYFLQRYLDLITTISTSSNQFSSEDDRSSWSAIAAMAILPLLCNDFCIDELLSQGTGVLGLIRSILEASATSFRSYIDTDDKSSIEVKESLQSTSCLCLSLLIALLEMGNPQRSVEEEEILQSLLSILVKFTIPCFPQNTLDNTSSGADMADMAAHAMALIASRKNDEDIVTKSTQQQQSSNKNNSDSYTISDKIEQAKKELLSTNSPPIRASGIATLLKIAKFMTTSKDASLIQKFDSPLITELSSTSVNDGNKPNSDQQLQSSNETVIWEIFTIAVSVLSDSESYVFLAAIQCLSCLADISPTFVLPLLCQGLVHGTIHLNYHSINTNESSSSTSIDCDQRVKLSEALLFAIRRRSAGIVTYQSLIHELIFGCSMKNFKENDDLKDTKNLKQAHNAIQRQTQSYFLHGYMNDQDSPFSEDDNGNDDDNTQLEKLTRIKTGGPLYQLETKHIIRSCCLSCLADIASLLPLHSMIDYCHAFIKLCIDALRLDTTRPVRRAAALLAKVLYEAVLDEALEVCSQYQTSIAIPALSISPSLPSRLLAMEMISPASSHDDNESVLYHTLQQIDTGMDITNTNTVNTKANSNPPTKIEQNCRLYDPATVARCREALIARSKSEEMGIFDLAKILIAKNDNVMSQNNTALFVSELIQQKGNVPK